MKAQFFTSGQIWQAKKTIDIRHSFEMGVVLLFNSSREQAWVVVPEHLLENPHLLVQLSSAAELAAVNTFYLEIAEDKVKM